MSQHERRRHQRYPLRLAIKVYRRDEVLAADIINASASGCLLQMSVPLEPGEALEVTIPELRMPKTRLIVVRTESTSLGYTVATRFEQLVDEPSISRLASGTNNNDPDGGSGTPTTH